eukprot:2493506-Pyramimonas_sp.AAC.1
MPATTPEFASRGPEFASRGPEFTMPSSSLSRFPNSDRWRQLGFVLMLRIYMLPSDESTTAPLSSRGAANSTRMTYDWDSPPRPRGGAPWRGSPGRTTTPFRSARRGRSSRYMPLPHARLLPLQ